MRFRINVLDSQLPRRASICREILGRGFHAELYDDLEEFLNRRSDGFVFIADDTLRLAPEEVFENIRESGQVFPVIFYAIEPRPERIVRAMLAGALDFLSWPFERHLLDATIQRLVFEGEKMVASERQYAEARRRVNRLSARERDVLQCLLKGQANKDIAMELSISPRTVEIHRGNMMRKLDANSASDAVRIGLYARLNSDFSGTERRYIRSIQKDARGRKFPPASDAP
jgi:two-component system, LuxR family, response regulator FixJ